MFQHLLLPYWLLRPASQTHHLKGFDSAICSAMMDAYQVYGAGQLLWSDEYVECTNEFELGSCYLMLFWKTHLWTPTVTDCHGHILYKQSWSLLFKSTVWAAAGVAAAPGAQQMCCNNLPPPSPLLHFFRRNRIFAYLRKTFYSRMHGAASALVAWFIGISRMSACLSICYHKHGSWNCSLPRPPPPPPPQPGMVQANAQGATPAQKRILV